MGGVASLTADVHLRAITVDNVRACVALKVADSQAAFIATNAWSMAQAKANPLLVPLAIYDGAARGYPKSAAPMVGFAMYEVDCGIGFIVRLMIDQAHQRRGYGRAALLEVIRRLRLIPEVEMIGTSHRSENSAVARLFESVGFVPWDVEAAHRTPGEVYLRLPRGGTE